MSNGSENAAGSQRMFPPPWGERQQGSVVSGLGIMEPSRAEDLGLLLFIDGLWRTGRTVKGQPVCAWLGRVCES